MNLPCVYEQIFSTSIFYDGVVMDFNFRSFKLEPSDLSSKLFLFDAFTKLLAAPSKIKSTCSKIYV